MGVDYTAYAVIGCEVDTEKLYRFEEIAHEHPAPDGAKFCPVCGAAVGQFEAVPIYDGDGPCEAKLGKFRIVWATDYERAWVGQFAESCWEDEGRVDVHGIEDTKSQLRVALQPLGLWDESTFGLWAVLHCSY